MPRTRLYRDGVLISEGFPVADVSDHIDDAGCVVWFDLCSPTPADLGIISEELGLHELAVEDVLHDHQRPKLDTYESHLFLTVYHVDLDKTSGRLRSTEINVFITKTALVTVRENDHFDIDELVRRWDSTREMAKHGVVYLLHGLLDHVVDGHFDVVQSLDEQIEGLEDELFDGATGNRHMQRRTFEMRKSMVQFRRLVLPMREVVGSLLRREIDIIEPVMTPYYQDVYDHVLRVAEWTDSLRDLVGNIRETHLTLQGYKLNEIMKKITAWAAVIAVPTMITGFYGQNVPYPGFGASIGFWTSSSVIVVASFVLFAIFKRKDWI
ncbi:magnesium transporter CorA family protein [Sinosporangium siamense]|uniref:Magnesium transporter CorA n=1 Tax=Sinosporangium siamense TaxID=1367973 RepID=A0A919RKQ4_9ACTN|nr:magnesium transporter CorA family protein [Sinosporangium siamense]GII93699.1 magnesium transporter CorA [Sinosporangium siamense]